MRSNRSAGRDRCDSPRLWCRRRSLARGSRDGHGVGGAGSRSVEPGSADHLGYGEGRVDADRVERSLDGHAPTRTTYSWRRCDQDGGSCSAISGANEKTYTLKPVDGGNTLRVRVTARNADGAASATSVPTALVTTDPTPAPTGCPSGTGTIQIGQLSPPARLQIDRQDIEPAGCHERHRPDHGALPRDGVRRPVGAGRARLRDGRAVQPVLDPGRAGHGVGRLGTADHGPAARLPGVAAPAAAGDVRPRAQERRERARRHLDPPPGLVPRQPARVTADTHVERRAPKGARRRAATHGRL